MTQIMKLLDLAPDIQEQILFLPQHPRPQREKPAAHCPPIDWDEQRRMFQKIMDRFAQSRDAECAASWRSLTPFGSGIRPEVRHG